MPFSLAAGNYTRKSKLHANEDRVAGWTDLEKELHVTFPQKIGLYMVADGHGGQKCSHYLSQNLPKMLMDSSLHELEQLSADGQDPTSDAMHLKQAVANLIQESETSWMSHSSRPADRARDTSGACLTVALVGESYLSVGNVGDCKAVIVRADGTVEQLTYDHRSDNPAEKTRIIKAGGYVSRGYVFGMLQPSRSIGDFDVKSVKGRNPKYPVLSWKPFVSTAVITETDMATIKETRAAKMAPVPTKRRTANKRLTKYRSSSDVLNIGRYGKEASSRFNAPQPVESATAASLNNATGANDKPPDINSLAKQMENVSVGQRSSAPPSTASAASAASSIREPFFPDHTKHPSTAPVAEDGPFDTCETIRRKCRFAIPPVCFLVLASDGVWDFMTIDHSVATIANELHSTMDPNSAAASLADEAVAQGSMDDVSVSVLWFRSEG
eukprot:gb/GECG01005747.1/.p1 GENE.gb/GECG01005747.1/~~gb/GECG01005747.1/.p1  ORF type:complete len:441 (+),score=37.67 gb/GECG01005747.1/:1-1323(+)